MGRLATLLTACALIVLGQVAAAADEAVDVELLLSIDVSRSIEPEEYLIQRDGYVAALTHPQVVGAMLSGPYGRVALSVVEWAGATQQRVVVPWTLVASAEDAAAIAGQLANEQPVFWRRTSISAMLGFAASLFDNNGFTSQRQIIDVSGDGPNNDGPPVALARDAVLARGIVINGLPLLTRNISMRYFELDDLDQYYQDCVVGGPGSFVIPVTRWEDFAETVRRKLVLELSGAPPPARLIRVDTADCMIGERIWRDRMNLFGTP